MKMTACAKGFLASFAGAAAALAAGGAHASDVAGRPVDDQVGFQRPVTEVMRDIIWLDDMLLLIITAIVLFVMALMGIVIFRFSRKKNPVPATFTHNAKLEVAWTAIPVLILVIIVVPSLRLLFLQLEVPEADLTVKATGNQWNWTYYYPEEDIEFTSVMIGQGLPNADAAEAELVEAGYTRDDWLLAADRRLVVPVGKVVHVLVTGSDVIHAFAVPSFGIKVDAVPGRTNETWFRAEETGTFYGQCSELCGRDHSYMPIVVEVVTEEEYEAWVAEEIARRDGTDPARAVALAD